MGAIINENIITIIFDDEHNVETPPLYQYDKGIVLTFLDIDDLVDIQFSNIYSKETINKVVANGKVTIPDSMLEQDSSIVAYVRYIDSKREMTEKIITIPVRGRKKPSDYIAPEDEPTFREDMQAIMNETKAIAEETKESLENFELSDEQIDKIAEQIDVSDKITMFEGNGQPSGNKANFPNVKLGDIYRDKNNTANVYMAVIFPTTTTVGWSPLPLLGYLVNNYYTQAQTKELIDAIPTDGFVTEEQVNELLATKRTKYDGNGQPSGIPSEFPNIDVGDIYFDKIGRKMYYLQGKAVDKYGNVLNLTWGEVVLSNAMLSYYTKTETDEKIQTAIEEALNDIPIAEGSEF